MPSVQPVLPMLRRGAIAAVAGVVALSGTGVVVQDDARAQTATAKTVPFQLVVDRALDDRLPEPEDRYALASGCYTIEVPGAGHVARSGNTLTVTQDAGEAAAFHFRATRLGEYLIAANDGPDTSVEGATWDNRSFVSAGATPLPVPVALGDTVGLASAPSTHAEWQIVAAGENPDARTKKGGQDYLVRQADGGSGLVVTASGIATGGDATPVRFHFVADDNLTDADPDGTACATWPEISTNTIGVPKPTGNGPGHEVRGLFETHVHAMAFEFLGGEARCGRPWHEYGVEFALVDCADHEPGGQGAVLEHAVSGTDPVNGHDTVGWPTFGYWPKNNSLTHEQMYWKWLERAWLGGLRMFVNLNVENQVLCEIYPTKRNSCNEMDSVRLQAKRMHEFQDYVDAQWGGPGEGWYRIVTTPSQARKAINAGRMAVIMGVEISTLFDCGEVLDQPLCTADDIDERLDEVYDMGVRQMEVLNKFDSALAGVKGDGGTTGILVNQANRRITGHYWDMQSCVEEDEHDFHAHDNAQMNFGDETPNEFAPIRDPLAGAIEQLFAPSQGFVAPLYGPAPHCNSRGFTDLGRHLIEQMAAKGMFIDPDHISARGQAELLAHIEDVLIPAEEAAAKAEGRAPVRPAIMSSHSWANDVSYRKIYELGGFIGPYAGSASSYANDWATRRAWFAELAPDSAIFGLGYGADTNGLGGQPGARKDPKVPLTYDKPWKAPVGGVLIGQQTSGVKTYDINVHGVAHYGLFADWFREVQLAADEQHPELGGGKAIVRDMLRAPEVYLQTWERAVYGGNECVTDQSMPQVEDLHALAGLNFEQFQEAIGRPASRDGAAYTYCAVAANGEVEVLDVVFGADGNAEGIRASTSGLQPQAPPAPAPDAADAGHPEAAPHEHDGSLPATGGGVATAALVLALAIALSEGLRRRRTA